MIDEELHTWFNDRERATEASLYGRRLYEVMTAYWPTAESDPAATEAMLDFARIWNAKPKIVFSTMLDRVKGNARLVTGDVGEVLAQLRTEFDGDLEVGGPTLAAAFIERGLVDGTSSSSIPSCSGRARRSSPGWNGRSGSGCGVPVVRIRRDLLGYAAR